MKILFIGAVTFSQELLLTMLDQGADIIGICGSTHDSFNSDYCNLSKTAKLNSIPYFETSDINSSASLEWIRLKDPEIIFCFGWSQLLKEEILQIPERGTVGYHPALIPQNRGRHPIVWTLALGLTETGSTFFYMNKDADAGKILSQEIVKVSITDTANTLYEKLVTIARLQIEKLLPELETGKIVGRPQISEDGNVWRKRNDADGEIDWRMSAKNILNLVRALTHPYVGAHFVARGTRVKVWEARIYLDAPRNLEPGKVFEASCGCLAIKCGENAVILEMLTPSYELKAGQYL